MTSHLSLLQIIRTCSVKKNSSNLLLQELAEYVKRYAKHYVQQTPDLIQYIEISNDELLELIKKLVQEDMLSLVMNQKSVTVIVPHFHIEKIDKLYKDIERREDVPFPCAEELPPTFPKGLIKKITLDDEFVRIVGEDGSEFLYMLSFSGAPKALVFPSRYTAEHLLILSVKKIQFHFRKDDVKDYLQKRLILANPAKDASIRSFVIKLQAKDMGLIRSIKEADDFYALWGQLCAFIKQDITKKGDKLPDEEALLQAVSIVDFLNNHYRGSHQKDMQKVTALKNLSFAFQRPPYYFTIKNITDFVDSRGIPLLGQYEESDLMDFLQRKTSTCESFSIPDILTFRNNEGVRFYVAADKLIPLLISLITEYRTIVKDACIEKWKLQLQSFCQDPSMKNEAAFHKFVKEITKVVANNLYSILEASFMSTIVLDKKINDIQAGEIARFYPEGRLAPYGELLMLNRVELLNDAKILLPFYYTLPLISSILAFFVGKKKDEQAGQKKDEKKRSEGEEKETKKVMRAPKKTFREVATSLAKEMLPEGLSMEEALAKYLDSWNTTIDKKARGNLTEDVNAFIRDYMRGIQRKLPVTSLDKKRVEALSEAVSSSSSLSAIKDKKALKEYAKIYILKILQTSFN